MKPRETTAKPNVGSIYAGPLAIRLVSPGAVTYQMTGVGLSQTLTYGYGGEHLLFDPATQVRAGQQIRVIAQAPGKAASAQTAIAVQKATVRTPTPVVKSAASPSAIEVSTVPDAFLYLKDAKGQLMFSGRSEPGGSGERRLDLSEFPPGQPYMLYAYVPGKLSSLPARVIVPRLNGRVRTPEVAGEIVEGTSTFTVKAEQGSTLKVYHWRRDTGTLDMAYSHAVPDGTAKVALVHPVSVGDRLVMTSEKSRFETSVALVKIVQEVEGPAVSPLQVDPVYSGDFFIGLQGSFDRVDLTDDRRNSYQMDNQLGSYAFGHQWGMLGRPVPELAKMLTLYVTQNGKKPITQQVPVLPNEGKTDPIPLPASPLYPGLDRWVVSAKPGDQIRATWNNASYLTVADSFSVTLYLRGILDRAKPGDPFILTIKSKGKEPASLTLTVQAAP